MNNDHLICAVIVSSYDGFQDVWDPFFKLFFRYWPDCPFKVYLISNELTYPDPRVKALQITPDRGWASNMIEALKRIDSPFFLYLQEDYFLERPVDTARIMELLRYLSEHTDIACLKLYPLPAPDCSLDAPMELGEITKGKPYRVSLQAGIWSRPSFLSLARAGETGWDMELNGSLRADQSPLIMGSVLKRERPLRYYYRTAIKKGKWMPGALRLCRREGITVDLSRNRPIVSGRCLLWGDVRKGASQFLAASGLQPLYARGKKMFRRKNDMLGFYRQFFGPGSLCFDIGANMGNRVRVFNAIGAAVVALEPQERCFDSLVSEFGDVPGITILKKAVGAASGHAEMMESDAHTISSMSREWIDRVRLSGRFREHTWSRPKPVEVVTLDQLIGGYGMPEFCKIDIEGYESEAIKGLTKAIPKLSFEFTPEFLESAAACVEHLSRIAQYDFNYSLGESMRLSLAAWVDSAEIMSLLRALPREAFGDVYARAKARS